MINALTVWLTDLRNEYQRQEAACRTDHREDEAYASWQTVHKKYAAASETVRELCRDNIDNIAESEHQ